MADQEAALAANQRFYKLPDFWSASPAAWFGVVEAQFLLRGTEAQRDRFALVSAVLPEASARRVAHILAAPGDTCYTDLKAALLAAHQLTSFQKAERLFSADPLGECRPSELLSEMLELVHPGKERTRLFAMLFLRRLPPPVRLQLTEDVHEDVRELAEKADRCAASIHRQQASAPIFSATNPLRPGGFIFRLCPTNRRCRPPTAGYSPSSPYHPHISFWIWGTGRSHSAWTASNRIWGRPSSHQPPPLAAAALSSQWLPLVRHLGGSSVDTAPVQ